jgi:hypothetical protein
MRRERSLKDGRRAGEGTRSERVRRRGVHAAAAPAPLSRLRGQPAAGVPAHEERAHVRPICLWRPLPHLHRDRPHPCHIWNRDRASPRSQLDLALWHCPMSPTATARVLSSAAWAPALRGASVRTATASKGAAATTRRPGRTLWQYSGTRSGRCLGCVPPLQGSAFTRTARGAEAGYPALCEVPRRAFQSFSSNDAGCEGKAETPGLITEEQTKTRHRGDHGWLEGRTRHWGLSGCRRRSQFLAAHKSHWQPPCPVASVRGLPGACQLKMHR